MQVQAPALAAVGAAQGTPSAAACRARRAGEGHLEAGVSARALGACRINSTPVLAGHGRITYA